MVVGLWNGGASHPWPVVPLILRANSGKGPQDFKLVPTACKCLADSLFFISVLKFSSSFSFLVF